MKLILAQEVINDIKHIRIYVKGVMDATQNENFYKVLLKIENALFGMLEKASKEDNENVE